MPCVAGAVGIVPRSRAFAAAMAIVHETMGQAKIEVFRRTLGEEKTAQRANRAFESAYAGLLSAGGVTALPGAVKSSRRLHENGINTRTASRCA
jgi:phosphoglycolate phosphatase